MVDTLAADARPKALPARLLGILTSPRRTYTEVAARPRVLGALCVVIAVSALATAALMSTEVGRQALVDQQARMAEAYGRPLSDAQYQVLQSRAGTFAYVAPAAQAVTLPLLGALIAGLALAVFNLMGGAGTFRQTYAIVVHSGAVLALQQLFVMPLDYARESLSNPTNLAVFFPFLDENSFGARLLGSVDLFVVWWIVSVAIGFGVLYKRRTTPIATAMLVVYVVLGAVIAGVKATMSGA